MYGLLGSGINGLACIVLLQRQPATETRLQVALSDALDSLQISTENGLSHPSDRGVR